MEQLIGKTFGQYQIVSELGRGGMAVVYKAYQPALERYVAVKVLPPQLGMDPDFVKRFQHEAVAAARLKLPHIVTIHDVGAAGGVNYIVMEFIEGEPLSTVIRQSGAMQPERVARIVDQVASALDYAHQQGFVHRDIKPGNIMLGAGDHVTLTDFGIAKAMSGTRLTQTGTLIGTPEYMSPEQVRGLPVDRRADIYSLGIVAYEMLSGQVPFSGDTASVLYKQAHELPPPIRARAINVSAPIAGAIDRALAKDPDQRFATAGDFARALAGESPVSATPSPVAVPPRATVSTPPPARPAPARPMRTWGLWAVGGVATLICALGLVAVVGLAGRNSFRQSAAVPPKPTTTSAAVAAAPRMTALATQAASTATPLPPPATVTAYGTTSAVRPGPAQTSGPVSTRTTTPVSTRTSTPALIRTSTPKPTQTFTPSPTQTSTPTPTGPPGCPPVVGPFADIWQSARDKLGCAANSAHSVWMAEEPFQKGTMFWRQDSDQIYALFAGGSWGVYANTWREGDAEETCSSGTPITPARGFGKVWCTVSGVRTSLGNATAQEGGYNGTVQDFERGLVIRTDAGATYVMYRGGKWEKR